MKYLLSTILVLFSTLVFAQGEMSKPPKIGIKVPLNEEVEVKGVRIRFLEVVEDSRCPDGTTCVWAGRAIVKAEVTAEGRTEIKSLILGETKPNEVKNTNLYSSAEFSINGLTLNPYPDVKDAKNEKDYVLIICEEPNR